MVRLLFLGSLVIQEVVGAMMGTERFGDELRRERESRGIALQAISDSTKISGRHLAALEQEQFERLPGGVFNKGIVRGYARVVGLDEHLWVDRYLSAYQRSGLVKQDDTEWVEFAENVVKNRKTEGDRPGLRLRWAGVLLLVTLIAGLGWFVYNYVREKSSAANQPIASPITLAISRHPCEPDGPALPPFNRSYRFPALA